MIEKLITEAKELLKNLIKTPSFSSEENKTAEIIASYLAEYNIHWKRQDNNIYAFNKYFDESKPTLLLNSHHDTVKPNNAYTKDPFDSHIENGKLYGLGSNDAGGCLVGLLATFVYFYEKENLNHNIIIVASAEEENSGDLGLNSILPILPKIDIAIVGEPTLLDLAIAEKGLVVFDAIVEGTPSHAAHPNDDNVIYKCIEVIDWFKKTSFDKYSEALGDVKLTVTQINGGKQHNVVPSNVNLVIDVRVNDCYTNSEISEYLQRTAPCKVIPRSLRLNSSSIPKKHPLVQAGIKLGKNTYGSPTLSDQAALSCHSLKLGPGDSTRSHSANEFIYVREIDDGVNFYINLLKYFL